MWKLRLTLLLQRLWQPTSACMTCMPGSLGAIANLAHWGVAVQTGLATGALALLLTFTPLLRLFKHRLGNALMVGGLTVLGDGYTHYRVAHFDAVESLATGAVSAVLALAASFLFEQRGRRLRALWARLG